MRRCTLPTSQDTSLPEYKLNIFNEILPSHAVENKKETPQKETELALAVFLLCRELSKPAEIVFLCAID